MTYNPLLTAYRGRFGKGRTVDDIVGLVEDLPPMPDVIVRALQLVDDPKVEAEEVAEVMEVSVGTVKSRILRGRRLLKNILDPLMHAQPESAPGASPDSQNHLSLPNHSSATAPRVLPAAGLVSVRTQRSTS